MFRIDRNINPTRQYINDTVELENGFVAHRFSILGTSIVSYDVLEPSRPMGQHSTITFLHNRWWGSVTTRPLPPEIDALPPYSQERIDAVQGFQRQLEREAEAIIRRAFPQDFIE